jgi:hypothetical protein
VATRDGHRLTVERAKCDHPTILVAERPAALIAGAEVPDPHSTVMRSRDGDRPTMERAQRNRQHWTFMAAQGPAERRARGKVPDPHGAILPAKLRP